MLQNLADIYDEQTLKDVEADYSRLSDVVVDNSVRRFEFEALCNLHYYWKMYGGNHYVQVEGDPQICG